MVEKKKWKHRGHLSFCPWCGQGAGTDCGKVVESHPDVGRPDRTFRMRERIECLGCGAITTPDRKWVLSPAASKKLPQKDRQVHPKVMGYI